MGSSKASSSFSARIEASIDHICEELKINPLVKTTSLELLNYLKPGSDDAGPTDVSEPVANAIACAIVSMAHEEAWRINRVPKHLPDRIIGKLYGISSSTVVYNRHLINSIITKRKVDEYRKTPRTIRTFR